MNEVYLQQLVEAVTKQVLTALQSEAQVTAANEGKEKLLVIGDPSRLPEHLVKNAVVCPLEDYKKAKNILRYQRVIIETLTLSQLADIAMGRDADAGSCAVTQALLNGVDVWMLETALPHRKCAGKGSSSFYQMLEGYVRTLQVFGIKLLGEDKLCLPVERPAVPPKFQAPSAPVPKGTARPNEGCLITEELATKMLDQVQDAILLPAGAILTPSARDVFTRARIEIRREA